MKYLRCSVSLLAVIALALVFIGCAKPPEAEKAAAKTALDAAVSAGADKYAGADFQAAKKLWDAAEAKMANKEYKEAKPVYVDAKAAFEKAAGAAAAGKKALADEVTAAAADLEGVWKSLEAAAKKVEKKLKDKKDAWAADGKTFAEGLKATKDMIAADPLGAKEKAGELKALIEKWDAAFQELASAPAKPAAAKKAKTTKKTTKKK